MEKKLGRHGWLFILAATVLLAVLGVQVGRGLANWSAGRGWTWPTGKSLFSSLPGVLAGDAGAGLTSSGEWASPTLLTVWLVIVELLIAAALVAATLGTILILPVIMGGKAGLVPLLVVGTLAAAAVLGPDQVLNMRRRARELEYTEGFPDLLDLLVASVEAGLSLEAAVSRVTDELVRRYPNLAIHLRFLTLELRAGKSRKDVWQSFASRLGIDDARALATMLRQAEDMGTSVGETLTVFSADMRSKRMLRAEEKALALPAKLTVPLILFIFPCLLGVLLLPAIFRLMTTFGAQ